MPVYPRRLNTYLRDSLAGGLAAELSEQQQLLRDVRAALPPGLGSQCRYCHKKQGQLIIQMESAAAATLLRFQAAEVLRRMAAGQGMHFTGLLIRNLIPASSTAEPPQTAIQSASTVRNHLMAAAEDCASEEIRASLLRLARTLELLQGKAG